MFYFVKCVIFNLKMEQNWFGCRDLPGAGNEVENLAYVTVLWNLLTLTFDLSSSKICHCCVRLTQSASLKIVRLPLAHFTSIR